MSGIRWNLPSKQVFNLFILAVTRLSLIHFTHHHIIMNTIHSTPYIHHQAARVPGSSDSLIYMGTTPRIHRNKLVSGPPELVNEDSAIEIVSAPLLWPVWSRLPTFLNPYSVTTAQALQEWGRTFVTPPP
jgi:hypothetical protein